MKLRAFLILSALILFAFWSGLLEIPAPLKSQLPILAEFAKETIQLTIYEVEAPPPLRATKESPQSFLSSPGIITETNQRRIAHGLTPFTEHTKLNESARAKIEDMFTQAYFAHLSPNGEDAGDLALQTGYTFIVIGENLALGNFANDNDIVQAWMDSPGHRENILNPRYTEIGVGVMRGVFEGKTTWLAVQHFARPLALCPVIDNTLRTLIDAQEDQLTVWERELQNRRVELDAAEPKRGPEYRARVNEYNDLVERYNLLLEETKRQIAIYNEEVRAFNACIDS